jgi:hypothetical protein
MLWQNSGESCLIMGQSSVMRFCPQGKMTVRAWSPPIIKQLSPEFCHNIPQIGSKGAHERGLGNCFGNDPVKEIGSAIHPRKEDARGLIGVKLLDQLSESFFVAQLGFNDHGVLSLTFDLILPGVDGLVG